MAAALIAGILWLPGPLRAQSQPPTSSSPPQLSAPLSSSELTSPSSSESSNVPPPPPTPPTLQTDLPDLQADTNPSVTIPDATGTPDAMGTPNREPIAGRRIVKQFDFNEHSDYNNPWRPIRADGFPADLHGRLDTQVGHAAPPSFRFDLNGGSIAYQYEGNDIAVRPNSDYLVSGWVKTSNLKQARAYMTAFFMDRKGILIDNTERTSELVGSDEFNTDWHPIQIQMTGDVPMARYLGIVLWVAQPSVWDKRPRNLRDIPREDIQGTAWFDDLSVFRLPRVALRSSSPGNIFVNHEPVVLLPEVTDPDGLNLTATLTVKSVDGTWVDERSIIAQPESVGPQNIRYDALPVGLYEAQLVATTQGITLVNRTIRFVCVGPPINPPQSASNRIGIVLENVDAKGVVGQQALFGDIHPEWIKLPVWSLTDAMAGNNFIATHNIDNYLQAIIECGAIPVGIQANIPRDQAATQKTNLPKTLLDLVSETKQAWRPLIAPTWARYTGLLHVWQFGSDRDESPFLDPRLPDVLPMLRHEMASLMSEPTLVAPASPLFETAPVPLIDYRAMLIPHSMQPDDFESNLRPWLQTNPEHVWITLEPLDDPHYPREARLADYACRLVNAAFLNPGAMFVFAPWDFQSDLIHAQVCPREEYILLRTIADVLSNAVPVSRTNIDGLAECLVFNSHGQAILFVQDPYAPPEGREHSIYLGDYAEQIDLWGRRSRLPTFHQQQIVRIGRMPTFIVGASTWLTEFRRQFVLTPNLVEANLLGAKTNKHQIVFKNTYREPISGSVRFVGPENWDIEPSRLMFSLKPGEEFRQTVEIRFSMNAEAGLKVLLGEFTLDADQRHHLTIPAWFELGLQGIHIETYALRKGDDAIIRVNITNQTNQPVSFDGDLIIPGRQRISRLFQKILPGQSVTKEYVLTRASELTGQHVRMHFNERQGSRIWNRLIRVP